MRIETTSGHTILADDADSGVVAGYSWWIAKCSGGRLYACAHVPGSGARNKVRIKMHRLLMEPPSGMIVHHKNNNGLDNRRSNLQVTTQRVNTRHAFIGAACVHFDKDTGRWRAQPRDETGKQISLGMFETEQRAKATVSNWRYRKLTEFEASGQTDLADAFEKCLLAAEESK